MSAQTTYNFFGKRGIPGKIVDLAPYEIDTYTNEENSGVLKFGIGVVAGTGVNGIKKPTATTGTFLGVTVNNGTTEHKFIEEGLEVMNKAAVGVMRYGRIHVRCVTGLTITPESPAYLVASGDNAGLFTNTSAASTIALAAKFLTAAENDVAVLELFNAPLPADKG